MKVGDLVKIKRRKGRPTWIGLIVDTYVTRDLVDGSDTTTYWKDLKGVIIHWAAADRFENYDESHWDMLEVISESR